MYFCVVKVSFIPQCIYFDYFCISATIFTYCWGCPSKIDSFIRTRLSTLIPSAIVISCAVIQRQYLGIAKIFQIYAYILNGTIYVESEVAKQCEIHEVIYTPGPS